MDRALDLKPEVTQGCGFESRLRAPHSRLSTAPSALGWVKCREHISLLIKLCIIVYVTDKAHLSLICIVNPNSVLEGQCPAEIRSDPACLNTPAAKFLVCLVKAITQASGWSNS